MTLKDNLKSLMAASEDNPNSLSVKTGVAQPTIYRIVEGLSLNPKRHTLERIARHYRVTVESLFGQVCASPSPGPLGNIAMDCAEIIDQLPKKDQVELLHHLWFEQKKLGASSAKKLPRPESPEDDDQPPAR